MSEFYSFISLNNISFTCIYYISFVHSSIDRHLNCFHLFGYCKLCCYEYELWISVQIPAFNYFGYIPQNGITVILSLIFWGTAKLFSTTAALFTFPPATHMGSNFSTLFPTLVVFYFLIIPILMTVKKKLGISRPVAQQMSCPHRRGLRHVLYQRRNRLAVQLCRSCTIQVHLVTGYIKAENQHISHAKVWTLD